MSTWLLLFSDVRNGRLPFHQLSWRRGTRAERYSATPFFFRICHTFSGVIGMSRCVPRGAAARLPPPWHGVRLTPSTNALHEAVAGPPSCATSLGSIGRLADDLIVHPEVVENHV